VGLSVAALLWGFAEATLFFIVPDVLLSAIAVRRGRGAALRAAGWTVVGALLGGALMYRWGVQDLAGAVAALDRLPAIAPAMIAAASDELARSGLVAMVAGALSGIPYKIYAVMAPDAGIRLGLFLAASIPARAVRLILVVLVADRLNSWLARRWSLRRRCVLLAAIWAAFYVAYFAVMPN
jgi:hypothetical protein